MQRCTAYKGRVYSDNLSVLVKAAGVGAGTRPGQGLQRAIGAKSTGNTGNGRQTEGAKENLILQMLDAAGNST